MAVEWSELMRDMQDMMAEAIDFNRSDVVGSVETWLKDEKIAVEDYRWCS